VLGLDASNPYAIFGVKESKDKLSLLAAEQQQQAVESERRNKINDILKSALGYQEHGDKVVADELKPLEDIIFTVRTIDELKQNQAKYNSDYAQWNQKRRHAEAIYNTAIREYFSILKLDWNDKTALQSIADIYRIFFDWSVKRNDAETSASLENNIRLYDSQGRYADFLKGDGKLKVNSAPPDASVYLFKLVLTADGRLAPEGYNSVEEAVQDPPKSCLIGQTPLKDGLTLAMGSYLLLLRQAGYADARYPVYIERNESETADIKLLKQSDIPPNMVYVPAGEFFYDTYSNTRVNLPAFFIGKYEVTMGDYLEYLNGTSMAGIDQRLAGYISKTSSGKFALNDFRLKDYPLDSMRLFEAQEYIKWRSKNDKRKYRLPSEPEWVRAARGADKRLYAWGNTPSPNFANVSRGEREIRALPRGKFPFDCSVYGAYDMTGNLSEWTSDFKITSGSQYSAIKGGRINWTIDYCMIDRAQLWMSNFSTFEIGFRLACSLADE